VLVAAWMFSGRRCGQCGRLGPATLLGSGAVRHGSTVGGMVRARYDAAADFYIRGFDSVDDPASLALLDMLGPVRGLRVLDVACGHGRITRELARRGARVVGIDISGALISKARQTEQNEPLGIGYVHDDVTTPGCLVNGGFDAVACNFGLSDIDDLDAAVAAVSGALRPGGFFVFSILHPCFAGGRTSRVPGLPPAVTTTRGTGRPRMPVPRCAGWWAPTTGCCRPISPCCGATACGSTSSLNRSRNQTGTRPMMPTASPSSS
jgi:SAM-dependent methyltransferase